MVTIQIITLCVYSPSPLFKSFERSRIISAPRLVSIGCWMALLNLQLSSVPPSPTPPIRRFNQVSTRRIGHFSLYVVPVGLRCPSSYDHMMSLCCVTLQIGRGSVNPFSSPLPDEDMTSPHRNAGSKSSEVYEILHMVSASSVSVRLLGEFVCEGVMRDVRRPSVHSHA